MGLKKKEVMKYSKTLLLSAVLLLPLATFSQSVGINSDGSAPDPSAILDIKSTTSGLLIPRMTAAQRTSISSPADGLMVYDTDFDEFWYYNGAWFEFNLSIELVDADGDTKVQVEASPDSDTIKFYVKGAEKWIMTGNRLEPGPADNSVFIGKDAGLVDVGGNSNVFVGQMAGNQNTSGVQNTSIGETRSAKRSFNLPHCPRFKKPIEFNCQCQSWK